MLFVILKNGQCGISLSSHIVPYGDIFCFLIYQDCDIMVYSIEKQLFSLFLAF